MFLLLNYIPLHSLREGILNAVNAIDINAEGFVFYSAQVKNHDLHFIFIVIITTLFKSVEIQLIVNYSLNHDLVA